MKLIKKSIVVIIFLLILASFYIIFFTDAEENKDTQAPTIGSITGDTFGTAGRSTTIYATFTDNIGVSDAKLHYKKISENVWRSISIISGNADIVISSDSNEDWQYYITVNDKANNGPVGNPSNDGSIYYTITVNFENKEIPRYVFLEEGTTSWCEKCPSVRDILHELFESGEYKFYYVSLVEDKNENYI